MAKIHQVVLAALLPFSFAAAQQSITLNDGTQYQGRFERGDREGISFVDQDGVRHRFLLNQVQALYFNAPNNFSNNGYQGNQPPPPPPPQYSNNSGYNQNGGYNGPNGPPPPPSGYNNNSGYNAPPANPGAYNNQGNYPPPQNAYATLPAGTSISVRTAESIHTSGATPGRTFPASIDQDVVDTNGNVVIPRGSPAALVVRDMGSNQIVLDLQTVSVNGQRYALNTQDVTQAGNSNRGLGANKRTGTYVGGGAVLGTLLGAIAGGGRGAAIGAVAGAAAGAGTQVLTRGSEVRVPAETVLNFQLDQPVSLYQ